VRNRYLCPERADYLKPKSHRVLARLDGLEDAQTVDCAWLTSPQGKGPRGKAVTLPCDTPVHLEVPYPNGAWIKVEIGGRQVAEVAARLRRGQPRRAGALLPRPHHRLRARRP
jgi:hypothetical protein